MPAGPASGHGARRVLRLSARARSARSAARASGRSPAARRSGPDTFRFFRSIGVNLKQVYGSTETTGLVSLQPDTEANPTTAGPPVPGHRGQDRRARRGARARRGRLQGLPQERGGHARGHRSATAGSTPGTPASSTRAATWSSSTAPRTSARWPTARRSRPSSSRTSSSSAPTSARRSPSATSGPFVTAMIAIDLGTVGNWAERRGLAYTSYMDLSPEAGGARADPRGDRARRTRPCRTATEDPALPAADQGPRGRRRGDDAHPEGAAPLRGREVRGGDRRASTAGRDEVELTTAITYEDGRQATHPARASASRTSREPPPVSDDFGFFLLLMSNGVLIGLMYALIALGFVLVYKATDAVNFAQGEFVMIAGFVVAAALDIWGAPLWLSIALGLGSHGRLRLRPRAGRCCASSSAGRSSPSSWPPSASPSILRGVGPTFVRRRDQAAAAAHPRRAVRARPAVHPAHPAAGRGA